MATVDRVPPSVSRVAKQQQFGELVTARIGSNSPFTGFAITGSSVPVLAVGISLAWFSSENDIRLLAFAGFFTIFALFPVLLVFGARMVARGAQSYYLYQGGLVRTWNGRPRAIPWRQIRQVLRQRPSPKELEILKGMKGFEDTPPDVVRGYLVHSSGAPRLRIEVGGVNDPDYAAFCDQFERLAAEGGADVTG